jgi:hypothetical protein
MTGSLLRNLLFHSRNFLRLSVKREDTAPLLEQLDLPAQPEIQVWLE